MHTLNILHVLLLAGHLEVCLSVVNTVGLHLWWRALQTMQEARTTAARLGASAAYQWQHVTGYSPGAILFWAGVSVTLPHMQTCVWSGECQALQASGDSSAQFETAHKVTPLRVVCHAVLDKKSVPSLPHVYLAVLTPTACQAVCRKEHMCRCAMTGQGRLSLSNHVGAFQEIL